MLRILPLLLVAVGMSGFPASAKRFVAVPDVEWEALVPYVRSTIVADLDGDHFQVLVCEGRTDRSVHSPFDEALGDFAKVLVLQRLRRDSRIFEGIAAATEGFRHRLLGMTQADRIRFRELLWNDLSASPHVLPRLRSAFLQARRAGRLRCWPCEKDGAFAPLAKRIAGRR